MNWLPKLELAVYVSIFSAIISLGSLAVTLWNVRKTRELARTQRRTQVLGDLFALEIKLVEAHQSHDGAQTEMRRFAAVREKKGQPLPSEIVESSLASGEEYLRELEAMQRECDELEERLERESRKMSAADLEDVAVEIGAIRSNVEIIIKKALVFQQEIERIFDIENRS